MSMLAQFIPFVNEQVAVQARLANRYGNDEKRSGLHKASSDAFRSLLDAVNTADKQLDAGSQRSFKGNPLTIRPQELEDLPPELLAELSEGVVADRGDLVLLKIVEENGGVASLDQILIETYKRTQEVVRRPTMTSRLYRMVQRGLLYSLANKKGVYSTFRIPEDEVSKLFSTDFESQPNLLQGA